MPDACMESIFDPSLKFPTCSSPCRLFFLLSPSRLQALSTISARYVEHISPPPPPLFSFLTFILYSLVFLLKYELHT